VAAGGAAGGVCFGVGAAAGAVAAKGGALFAGSKGTGFRAVWHEEADRSRRASMVIRIWSFATRIFLYEIRMLPGKSPVNSIKNRTSPLVSGQRRKRNPAVTFDTGPNGYPQLLL
jgi:hypothetical protein